MSHLGFKFAINNNGFAQIGAKPKVARFDLVQGVDLPFQSFEKRNIKRSCSQTPLQPLVDEVLSLVAEDGIGAYRLVLFPCLSLRVLGCGTLEAPRSPTAKLFT